MVDCRPLNRITPQDAEAFEPKERACRVIGWSYQVAGAVEPVLWANIRWLASYRHPRHMASRSVEHLLGVFARPPPVRRGVERVGDPIAVLPVVFHLLWCGVLVADLSMVLGEAALVSVAEGAGR